MRWNKLDNEACSMARTVSVIGDRWTLLILRDCFLRVRRFEEFLSLEDHGNTRRGKNKRRAQGGALPGKIAVRIAGPDFFRHPRAV